MVRNLVLVASVFVFRMPALADDSATSQPTTRPAHENNRTIVFVCDASVAMGNTIAGVKTELSLAVESLRPSQSFDIVLFQGEKTLRLGDRLLAANPDNKQKAHDWLQQVAVAGTNDPVPALNFALKLRSDFLYFLTDSANFPDAPAVQKAFRGLNSEHKTRVNTILLVADKDEQERNKDSEAAMRAIARENGGVFKWVRMDQLNRNS